MNASKNELNFVVLVDVNVGLYVGLIFIISFDIGLNFETLVTSPTSGSFTVSNGSSALALAS